MPAQISPAADRKLNTMSRKIGQADVVIEEQTNIKKRAWEEIDETLQEFNKSDVRFLADDGEYLTLSLRRGKVSLDEKMLSLKLQALKDSSAKFRALWRSITVPVVDPNLLESARNAGKIPQEILNECLTTGADTIAHLRQPWTADDKNRARVLGITPVPSNGPMVSITKEEYDELLAAKEALRQQNP